MDFFNDRICLTVALLSLLAGAKAVNAQIEFSSRINHQPWDVLLKKYVNNPGPLGYRAHGVLVCCARSCPPLQRSATTGKELPA
jgi:hypothetical protein